MFAVTRVLSSTRLRTGVLALATLAGAASALAMPDRDDHDRGRDRWRYGHDDWRSHDSHSRTSVSLSFGFGVPIDNCRPAYVPHRTIIAAPYCPPPIYTTRYCEPPVRYCEPPVRRVIVESTPVYYSPPPQVIYTQPQQVVVQQPQPQVIYQPAPVVVQQPAPVVVQQPAPVQQVSVVAAPTPAPAAPSRVYRDVAPSELNISAFRTGDTIMVLVNGVNTMEGYSTSLTINDVNSDAVLVLHNEPPVVTQNLKNSGFTVNASVRLAGNPKSIGVRVADRTYQVPVTDVQSVSGS